MSDDLLSAALSAVDAYFRGEFATKKSIRQEMENLRQAAFAEQKRRQQDDTQPLRRKE